MTEHWWCVKVRSGHYKYGDWFFWPETLALTRRESIARVTWLSNREWVLERRQGIVKCIRVDLVERTDG